MTRQIRCECGYTARGETDDEVISQVLAHLGRPPRPGRDRDGGRPPRLDRATTRLTTSASDA